MTERQELLLVLVLVYLAENLRWVRRGGVVFRRALGRKFSSHTSTDAISNDQGDLYWTFPLPDFGEFFVARGCPWSFCPKGVATWSSGCWHPNGRPLQPQAYRSWAEIQAIELDGPRIFVGGQLWWTADSQVEAHRLARLLKSLANLPETEREAAIRQFWKRTFAVEAVRQQLERVRVDLRPLRLVGQGMWAILFLALPLAVRQWGWIPALPIGLGALFAGGIYCARRVVRTLRTLSPDATSERTRLGLLVGFSPITAIRAFEMAGRYQVEEFDPLAVGLAVLEGEAREEWAGEWRRDVEFPRVPENPYAKGQPGFDTVEWSRTAYREAGLEAIRAAGLDSEAGLRPPAPTEAEHRLYCARCQAQFLEAAKSCAACGGRPLVAWGAAPTAKN